SAPVSALASSPKSISDMLEPYEPSQGGVFFKCGFSVWSERLKFGRVFAVRPAPPFNVSVKTIKDSFTHITWNHGENSLTFRLRIRSCRGDEKPVILETPQSFVQLSPSVLPPAGCRRADVQARFRPGYRYEGPWSEWSAAASWTDAADGTTPHLSNKKIYIYIYFPLKVMAYVPDPGEFFKPLYSSYQGDFKAWVKPAFAGHASLMDLGYVVTRSSLSGSGLALSPVHSVSLESVSTASLPELYGDLREADAPPPREQLHLSNLHIVQDFDGDEWSGNDYPLMDLDTIDSGFGECSSPPATEQLLCRHEATDSGPDLSHSSYVKQWTTAQDEEQSLQQDFQMEHSGTL
uniref:Fibronectin type-III domain-containing protein n=1 Tax=Neogobius melanostomus TaxID=47308 RepID=A0A8C6SEP5_9GOBI